MIEYDKTKYKAWTWKYWANLHWIINPGIAVAELLLGIRAPKNQLFDIAIDKPFVERQYVPCPHCGNLNNGLTWSSINKTQTGNWGGLYCPKCGGIIPCLRNLTSLLIIIITFPIWGWFIKSWKSNWLKRQPGRFKNISFEIPKQKKTAWIRTALIWGGIMFIFMQLCYPLISGETITLRKLMIGLVIWTCAGLGFGYWMKVWGEKKVKAKNSN